MLLIPPSTSRPPVRGNLVPDGGRSLTAASLIILAVAMLGRQAHAADRPRVVYLGTEAVGVDAETQKRLDPAAVRGIETTPVTYVPVAPSDVPHTGDGYLCSGPTCIDPLARKTQANFFVRAEVRPRASGECCLVKIQAIRADPFGVVVSEDFDCQDRCKDQRNLAVFLEFGMSEVMLKLVTLASAPASPPPAVPPSLTTPPADGSTSTPPPGADVGMDSANQEPTSRASRWGPWILGGGGALAVVSGGVLFAVGDISRCSGGVSASECGRYFDGRLAGGLIAAGGALAVGGAVLWWKISASHGHPERQALLSVTPRGLILRASF